MHILNAEHEKIIKFLVCQDLHDGIPLLVVGMPLLDRMKIVKANTFKGMIEFK